MSYDYMLYRPAPGAADVPERASDVTPLGTFAEIAAEVDRAIPGIEWERRGEADDPAWWGTRRDPGYVEVRLRWMDPGDTLVSFVWLKRVDREMVEGAAGALALVALDTQTMETYRPGRPGWKTATPR